MTATLRNPSRPALSALVLVVGAAFALPGCGSDDPKIADASKGEPFKVSATGSFAPSQSLGAGKTLKITVRNEESSRVIPDVSIVLEGLQRRLASSDNGAGQVADPRRPLWIVDAPPAGGQTAYVNTWALGPLKAGQERTFRWRLTPVVAGTHEVTWKVTGSLDQHGPVQAADGGADHGAFRVRVGG